MFIYYLKALFINNYSDFVNKIVPIKKSNKLLDSQVIIDK
jgi:hypothetical protein